MRENYLPITNIEDALQFLAQRRGKIEFLDSPRKGGIVVREQIRGVSSILQNEWAHPQVEINNANFEILTQTIITLAEGIRREDAASNVNFKKPETP